MTDAATLFGFTYGASHVQTQWADVRQSAWPQVVELLTSHVPGPKEGSCIAPAQFSGTRRHKDSATRIDMAFLDSDSGASLAAIEVALKARGWEAVVSSTHSHMTTQIRAKLVNWDRFFAKAPAATAADFLVQDKGYLPGIAQGAKAVETRDGYVYIEHQPCPKFRIAIPLKRPWIAAEYLSQDEANEVWKARIEALAAALGLSHDQACTDTSRLFYLPRHPGKGVVPETAVVSGQPCDIFSLATPQATTADGLFGQQPRKAGNDPAGRDYIDPITGEIIDLADWAKAFGGRFLIAKALKTRKPGVLTGHIAETRVHIDCPNAGAHTDAGRDGATFVSNGGSSATKGFVIHCRHAHCTDHDRLFFVRKMLEEQWITSADLIDPAFQAQEGDPRPEPPPRGRKADERTVTWPEPIDLLGEDVTGTPDLRPEHVPTTLWPFIHDTADRMGVDASAVAFIVLAVCASVITDDWKIQPKRLDYTWVEQARLWAGIVGDPSILKTPILAAASKPIDKLEAKARREHQAAMLRWEQDCAIAKIDKQPPPRQPKCDRYMVEGITPEALSEVLRDDNDAKFRAVCKKQLVRQDEMSEWIGGMDRYAAGGRGGAERGSYLRLYNGGRYTVDRIGRGSFAVPNWSACFIGGIQPGPIQKIAKDAADDGLIQRFMLCVPAGQGRGQDRAPDAEAIARYDELIVALTGLWPTEPEAVQFHPAAHRHREEIDDLAVAMQHMPDTSKRMKATLGKWPGLFARLCLTFHLVGIAGTPAGRAMPSAQVVQEDTAGRVVAFMREILLPHMQRAEAVMFATAQTSHARWLAGHILSHGMERIQLRDITKAYRALQAPECRHELMSVMAGLQAAGWVEPDEPGSLIKGVTTWTVNPGVHSMFAERAAREADRREAVRMQIANAREAAKARKGKA